MSNFIKKEQIQLIQDQVNIVDLISDYVVLKQKGTSEYQALCPFHNEKTPSFWVNEEKKVYHCFGCGEGGGVVNFVMNYHNCSFKEAIFDLSDRFNIPIKVLDEKDQEDYAAQAVVKAQIRNILEEAQSYYQEILFGEQGHKAIAYLKSRGLTEETILQFGLGFAPPDWDSLYKHLQKKGFSSELIEQAGLIKKSKNNSFIDYFHRRVMFPICDRLNQVVGFGGRGNGENPPKYLNSPDTIVFNKSEILYGLNYAIQSIKEKKQAIVVEGYFDVLSLHQNGIENTVAVMGTAFSKHHLKLLGKQGEIEIVLNFDNDNAGVKAIDKALKESENLAYSGMIDCKILTIPNAKDSAEYLQQYPQENYHELINNSPSWFDWKVSQFLGDRNLSNPKDYNHVFKQMVALLKEIPDTVSRSNYLLFCAETLSQRNPNLATVELPTIQANLEKAIVLSRSPEKKQPSRLVEQGESQEDRATRETEFLILLIYLNYPHHRSHILSLLDDKDLAFTISSHRNVWLAFLKTEEDNSPQSLKENAIWIVFEKKSDRTILSHLLNPPELLQNKIAHSEDIKDLITRCINHLEYLAQMRYLNHIQAELSKPDCDREFCFQQIQAIKSQLTKQHTNDEQPF